MNAKPVPLEIKLNNSQKFGYKLNANDKNYQKRKLWFFKKYLLRLNVTAMDKMPVLESRQDTQNNLFLCSYLLIMVLFSFLFIF